MKRNTLITLAAAALCACGSLSADSDDVGQFRSRLLDSSAIAGDWSGTSIDKAGVAGVVTATFSQLSPRTFSGSMHAYFPDFGASADCNITGGN